MRSPPGSPLSYEHVNEFHVRMEPEDRLCGLVGGVPGYRSRGSGIDSRRCHIF
jgi:hypothetical protein